MKNVKDNGWNNLTLAVSQVRLAALRGERQAAKQMLELLFDRGFRDLPLML